MFTINIYLRFAIMAVCLIGGLIMAFVGDLNFWGFSFPFLLIGVFLLVGYLLLGTVQSAAMLMQSMDFNGTEKRLGLTLAPRLLYSTNRAYFYMMKGSIAQQRNQVDEAEMWLNKAQSIKLPSDNERAMIQLQLANLAATKNKWSQAKNHFRNAKQGKITDANIKEQLKQFEKALNNRGQQFSGGKGQAAMRPGGKRRRPKMR